MHNRLARPGTIDWVSGDIIEELQWRGLIAQSTDLEALRAHAAEGPITLYAGFDPTAASLHAGHLVPLLTLRRFQQFGHRPLVLAGGATGQIGDPRDEGERVMNSTDTVAAWADTIAAQLARFVDFDGVDQPAIAVNNLDWTENLTVPQFLRDIGKHFSLNVMLARDTVKRRLESDGISYTEFSYMLLQAYDFVELNRRYGCTLQVGGADQWGNVVSGVDLNRRMNSASVHAFTVPLVTSADGKKLGKSTGGGSIWLDPELTSPYAWHQYFVNTADADVIAYLKWFTFLSQEQIAELAEATANAPQRREAQKRLARELTTLVHGADAAAGAELAALALFGRGELADLDERTLRSALAEASLVTAPVTSTITDLLVATGLSESRGAARRAVAEGGAYVNNEKIGDEGWTAASAAPLHGKYLVLRRGKKTFGGVELTAG